MDHKKIWNIIILIVLINLTLQSVNVLATKVAIPILGTMNESLFFISQSEEKSLITQEMIDQISAKGLDNVVSPENYESSKKAFDSMIDEFEESQKNLELAKKYFDNEDYYQASDYAKKSTSRQGYIQSYLSLILNDGITPDGLRVSTVITTGDGDKLVEVKDSDKAPIEGTIDEIKVEYINETKKIPIPPGQKAPIEGIKEVIKVGSGATEEDCNDYTADCKRGNNAACFKWEFNCGDTKVKIKKELEIKDNKVYMGKKEVKIMPSTASETAIQTLQLKKEIVIEHKDTGKPIYEIVGKKEVKILGLIKKEMLIKIEINAETGNVEVINKP